MTPVESAVRVAVGDAFERTVALDAAAVTAFAKASGDPNPLHHDAAAAGRSRFGGLIASGPHTSSLMMGLCATWFTERGESVGLEFTFRFRRAVPAGDVLRIRWTVVSVVPKASLGGDVVTLDGRAWRGDGQIALEAKGAALLLPVAA